MKRPTFIEYLAETMVDVDTTDPVGALNDVKAAIKNPDRQKREQLANNVDKQKEIQKSDDPNKSLKLRNEKLKQQVAQNDKRIDRSDKQAARRAGANPEGGQM